MLRGTCWRFLEKHNHDFLSWSKCHIFLRSPLARDHFGTLFGSQLSSIAELRQKINRSLRHLVVEKCDFGVQIMAGCWISALDGPILMIQKPKSIRIARENQWTHFQVCPKPLRPWKTASNIFQDWSVSNFVHNFGKYWPIFKFLDNFPHYSSSPTIFVLLEWPPEGAGIERSNFRQGSLFGALGPHPMDVPSWKAP